MNTEAKSTERRILNVSVTEKDTGLPLGRFLTRALGLSRRQISSLKFRQDGLRVNGQPARTSRLLAAGDTVSVRLNSEGSAPPAAHDEIKIPPILFENEDLIVVNKPSGVVCHPSHGHYADSLASILSARLARTGESAALHVIGRLDKDTSGAMIYAKNAEAAALLARPGAVRKTYYAVAEGLLDPPAGVITAPLAPDPVRPGKMKTDPGGKPARTRYETLSIQGGSSLLRLRLTHGRTHQIRVHLASIGHPLLGDPLYGNGTPGETRAMLHCGEAQIRLPFSEEVIALRAPFPADWPASVVIS